MDTVTLTIDGRPITVEKGTTVLHAAISNGLQLPFYCYHPGLTVDGSCRVCVVSIEKMPKLQTSCSTPCTDGMVVSTRTPEAVEARASVLEFLLINHPLDCPVCDKGGECPLQDFAYTFGPARSRMEFARRTFDGEGVRADVDFGPTLMLNRNRCILCTRCVRFMREIDTDPQINIIDRGYGSEIATFNEEGVHSLLSGNLMDVCPVGAITTKDYRFKARPWDNPEVVDTICTSCSKGCNTTLWLKAKPEWARGARLVRITPRLNPEINGYWMCDIGRFEYHWIEGERRARRPLARPAPGRDAEDIPWSDALARVGDALRARAGADPSSLRFLASAHASLEELFLLRRLAGALLGDAAARAISIGWRCREKPQPPGTRFSIPPVDAPNVQGARDLGLEVGDGREPDLSGLRADVEGGRVALLYLLDPGPDGSVGDVSWIVEARRTGRLPMLVVQGTLLTDLAAAADIVLPGATFAEKDASYTNDQGRVQTTAAGPPLPGEAREDWRILAELERAAGSDAAFEEAAAVRAAIASALGDRAEYAPLAERVVARPIPARHWLQTSNPSERWKWDFLFQDLPPVKGAVDPSSLPPVIPLRNAE